MDDDNTRMPPRIGVSDNQAKQERATKLAFGAAVKNEPSKKKPLNDNSNGSGPGPRTPSPALRLAPKGMRTVSMKRLGPTTSKEQSDAAARKARIAELHKKMRAEKDLPPAEKPRSLIKDHANKSFKGDRGGR